MSAGHDLQRADALPEPLAALQDVLAAAIVLLASEGWTDPEDRLHDCWFVRRSARKRLVEAVEAAAPGRIDRTREELR